MLLSLLIKSLVLMQGTRAYIMHMGLLVYLTTKINNSKSNCFLVMS